jgi:hypothetical protein
VQRLTKRLRALAFNFIAYNGPGHLRRTKVRRTGSKKSGVFLKCLVVRRLLLNPLFRPGPLCKRGGFGAFFKAKILRLRSPLYHERVEGGEQLLHNVLGLCEEADFEALNFLPALDLIRSTKLQLPTEPAFLPNAC